MKKESLLLAALSVCLCALTYVAFCLISGNDFVRFDDFLYVTENPHVLSGLSWDSIKWAFTTTETGNWIPLTWISHMADVQLLGLNAGYHHLMNLGFHTVNALLLFLLFYTVTRRPWVSFLAALLFAVHPLRVESVAWVSERKDTLSTFFGLLSLWSYVVYAQRKSKRSYWLCMIFLILGLMSKAMLVTWPFVFLLMDYWPLKRFAWLTEDLHGNRPPGTWTSLKPLLIEKIPFGVVILIFSIVGYYAQKMSGAVVSGESIPILYRLENIPISYVLYLKLMVYPKDLAVYYPMFPEAITHAKAVSCLALLTAVTGVLFWQRKRKSYLLMGWLWFLGTMVPVIGFLKIGGQAMADRYTYVPSIGIAIMLAFGLADLASRRLKIKIAVIAGTASTIAVLIFMTWIQTSYWKNNRTLFSHTLAVTGRNYKMHILYGAVLLKSHEFDAAAAQFEDAHKLIPSAAIPLIMIAKTQMEKGDYNQAIALLNKAAEQKDAVQDDMLFLRGTCRYKMGQLDDATADLSKALKIAPDRIDILVLLAEVYTEKGLFDQALDIYEKGLNADPHSLLLLNRLAEFYLNKMNPFYNPAKALEYAQRACLVSDFKYSEPIMTVFQILDEHKELEKTLNNDFMDRVNQKTTELKRRPESNPSTDTK